MKILKTVAFGYFKTWIALKKEDYEKKKNQFASNIKKESS